MKISRRQLREMITEVLESESGPSEEFSIIPTPLGTSGVRIHTPQDNASRDIVFLKHPDGSGQGYFRSSGVSGGGYKGSWIPFEGWSTHSMVPKGETYSDLNTDEDIQFFEPGSKYGDHAWLVKTYGTTVDGKKTAQAPQGTIHAAGSQWINDWIKANGDIDTKTLTITDAVRQFQPLNRWMWNRGAIDRSLYSLRVHPTRGRRLQFGLDDVS